ncbi:MAG: hypothetical protein HW387_94 [Parachlamydiales bacterium]|nr:hypothetical protein [Parachlamydiales bacterium]
MTPIIFRAQWTDENRPLKEPDQTLTLKIKSFAWLIFSIVFFPIGLARMAGWFIGFAAKKLVLPAAWDWRIDKPKLKLTFDKKWGEHSDWRNSYQLQEYQIKTPDGALLCTHHFRRRQSPAYAPTIILFQSNATISSQEHYEGLIDEFLNRKIPCNFVQFDYRGVDRSVKSAESARDLFLDADSVIQFVEKQLKVPPGQIQFYGWSLGGAIAVNVMQLHPECTNRAVLDRTFSSISRVPQSHLPSFLSPLLFWLPFVIRSQGWEINTVPAAQSLQNRILAIYHPDDSVIPYSASLHKAIPLPHSLKLTGNPYAKKHHLELLSSYKLEPHKSAQSAAVDFLISH